jgi:hypothetical protein
LSENKRRAREKGYVEQERRSRFLDVCGILLYCRYIFTNDGTEAEEEGQMYSEGAG